MHWKTEKRSEGHYDVICMPSLSLSTSYPELIGHIHKKGTVYIAESGPEHVGEFEKRHQAAAAIYHHYLNQSPQ